MRLGLSSVILLWLFFFFLFVNVTQAEVIREEETQLRKCPHKITYRQVLIKDCMGGPSSLWVVSLWVVGPGLRKKAA